VPNRREPAITADKNGAILSGKDCPGIRISAVFNFYDSLSHWLVNDLLHHGPYFDEKFIVWYALC